MPLKTRNLRGRKKRFIDHLLAGESVARAAMSKDVGISRREVYNWKKEDVDFSVKWDDAVQVGLDLMEDESRRRAMDSSDGLLSMWLKCRRPEVWNQPPPAQENNTNVNVRITTVMEALNRMEQLGLPPMEIEGDFDIIK
jgi:hypothetical protein